MGDQNLKNSYRCQSKTDHSLMLTQENTPPLAAQISPLGLLYHQLECFQRPPIQSLSTVIPLTHQTKLTI